MKPSSAAKLLPCLLSVFALSFLGCSSNTEDSSNAPAADAGQAPQVQDNSAAQDRLKQKAIGIVAEARSYANEGKYADALAKYDEALRFDGANADAIQGRADMQRMLAKGNEGAADPANNAVANREAQAEKAKVYYNDGLMARAKGDLEKAVQDLTMAHQLVKYDPLPTTTGLTQEQVKRALDETQALKDEADRTADQRRRDEIAKVQAQEEERERNRLQRRLMNLHDNAISKFESEEFERCENICDEILRLDFQNKWAEDLKEAARRARHALATEGNLKNYRNQYARAFEELKTATVFQTTDVKFPSELDWKKKTARGDRSLQQGLQEIAEEDREVKNKLSNLVLPSVDWNGKKLDDVIASLSTQVGVNIFATPEAKNAAAAELNLELKQVTAERALEAACDALSVVFTIADGLVKIQTKDEAKKEKVIEFYEVSDLTLDINSFPGVSLNLSASGYNANTESEEKPEPIHTLGIDSLITMIKKAVDPESDEGNKYEPKNGVLIVRQTPAKQRLIKKILDELRRDVGLQVSIESRFITVENNFLQEIGVDLRGLGNDSAGVGVPGVGRDRTFDDFGLPGVAAGSGAGANINNSPQAGVGTPSAPAGIGSGTDSGFNLNDFSETDVRSRSENLFDERLGKTGVIDETGGASFQFAFLDDTQLEAILRAVQKYERLNTVHAPKLMLHNTQRASLQVLQEVAYIKDFDVEIAQAAVIADPIVDKVREGVVLDVKAIVSHDRKYVTLELKPEVANLIRPIRQFQTQLGIGAAVTIELPELHKESVQTTVVVPDGGTLLLGGLKFAEEKTLDSKVPFLGDIPVLSFFFSKKGQYTNLKDLLILVKVKIVILNELEPGANGDDTAPLR